MRVRVEQQQLAAGEEHMRDADAALVVDVVAANGLACEHSHVTDGPGSPDVVTGVVGRIIAAIIGKPRGPKLKVSIAARREDGGALWIWVRATNEGGGGVTIDYLSSWVLGRRRREIEHVRFSSGPEVPFRLKSYDSAVWEATVPVEEPWMAGNVKCRAYIAGGGLDAGRACRVAGR
jgi:hypothetical protein